MLIFHSYVSLPEDILILASLLVLMEISTFTSKEFIFFAGYLGVAMNTSNNYGWYRFILGESYDFYDRAM